MAANPFNELSEKLDALSQQVAEINRKMQEHPIHIDKPLTVKEAASYLCLSKKQVVPSTSGTGSALFQGASHLVSERRLGQIGCNPNVKIQQTKSDKRLKSIRKGNSLY